MKNFDFLKENLIAHRGLHSLDTVENTLKAFIRAMERKKVFEENNLRSLKISTGIPHSMKTISKRVSLGDRIILRDEVGDLYVAPVVGKNSPFLGKTVGEKILIDGYECTIVSADRANILNQSIQK